MSTLVSARCRDWRACDAADVLPLVDAEVRAWRETLSWDVAEAWSVIEPARQAGHLPGLLAFDTAGRPAGWTSFLPHNGHLQVMALVAADETVAAALVDGIVESVEARACDGTVFCVRDATPGLTDILSARGFDVDAYRYLTTDLAGVSPVAHSFDRWDRHDDAMASLCAVAYRDRTSGIRAFAPGGTSSEWRQYVATLVQGTGCGWFLPELSLVVSAPAPFQGPRHSPDRRLPGLQAGLMLTDLGTGSAHIAQLVVDPSARGRGLGRQLVAATMGEASRFYEQMSLLVSGTNVAAVRLYASLGFRDHARFIVASRPGSSS